MSIIDIILIGVFLASCIFVGISLYLWGFNFLTVINQKITQRLGERNSKIFVLIFAGGIFIIPIIFSAYYGDWYSVLGQSILIMFIAGFIYYTEI